MTQLAQITPLELVELAAIDNRLYTSAFFGNDARQEMPDFHLEIWKGFEAPHRRYSAFEVFRGSAKTTLARIAASKRIAYGVSRVILMTSSAERHAVRSVNWVASQVEYNTKWASTYGLRKGAKWTESEIEIIHGVDEVPIRVLAIGITGQVRGINIGSYRPDLIICDDVDDEDTTNTKDQIEKYSELFWGSLMRTLSAPTEATDARVWALATPLADGDRISEMRKDPLWHTVTYGCFDERGESRWPSRYPTDYLLQEKAAYVGRGQLSLWLREMECTLVNDELASFRVAWLQDGRIIPQNAWFAVSIDPASSDSKTADFFAMTLLAFSGRKVFIVEIFAARGVDPDMAVAKLFEWFSKYAVRKVVAETVAYQRVLKWYIEKKMLEMRQWRPVVGYDDRRRKDDRILQAIQKVAPYGDLHVHPQAAEAFRSQYDVWHPGAKMHDDILDAVAIGISACYDEVDIEGEFERLESEEAALPRLVVEAQCP